MPNEELRLEREHLADTLEIVRAQLANAMSEADVRGREIERAGREMAEEERRSLDSLWAADAFEEAVNFSQLVQPRSLFVATRAMAKERARALGHMLNAPYFARIDLTFEEGDWERVYIGRATLKDEQTYQILIHDWRAPVSSVFYRFGAGPVHYTAPGGEIACEMTRKRQYEIKGGVLVYFFDADVEVQDEFLRAMLAQSASARMRAIVETIQRDQDLAVRDTANDLLMVQGAAGSGKSSVALHRAAYLMYTELTSPLKAGDILILSPNDLFERYIYNVLPELGEENANTTTYERLLESIVHAPVEPRYMRFERLQGAPAGKLSGIKFKSSPAFVEILNRFARELVRRWLGVPDLCYAGQTLFQREELIAALERDEKSVPLGVRLFHLENRIWEAVAQKRAARMKRLLRLAGADPRHAQELEACARAYSILECAQLSRHIRAFTRLDARALYARLMRDERALRRLAANLELPDDLAAILAHTREALSAKTLSIEDAAPIAYLARAIERPGKPSSIRQVIVDEAQDYDAMDFAVLNRVYPRARFTVLGDVNQALDRRADLSLYDRIAGALDRRACALVTLTKSFRCTREILAFSLRFLDSAAGIESFSRSGEAPKEYLSRSPSEAAFLIGSEIERCRAAGMRSIALIAETASSVRAWQTLLDLPLIRGDSQTETVDAFLIPLALSKGLEFDAVLVLDTDRWAERRHLYVACTRALHRLSLFSAVERGKEET